ncbi:MAG: formate dehydrogenase subunit alpha [Spirochaetales bacterium]|nr:formate dehydrogenase subunit alpha [Spirochaetales bacterium]
MAEVKITLDGRKVNCRSGRTILEIAGENGVDIPHLCHDDRLTPTGACRLCLVEIEGQRGLQTACTREAEDGMVIRTATKEIMSMRRATLELLISEHRLSCTTCDSDGDCLLQDYAYQYQVNENRYPFLHRKIRDFNYTSYNLAIKYDPSKCISCQRCVKICREVQGAEALTIRGRTADVIISTGLDLPLKESPCETCGQCVSTCPTGALYEYPARRLARAKDLRKVRTTCNYCGVGCQLDLNVHRRTGKIVRVTSETGVIPNDGNTCVKGRFGFDFISSEERLRVPLIKEEGIFREASWDEALSLAARRLTGLKDKYGPQALAGLSSARTTNEENFVMQKFVRAVLGTNNVDHCARLCHASTVAGLARAFGSGAMTNSIAEIGRAPVIFVIGSNTTECHPIIGINIRKAVAGDKTKLIVADPRRISLAGIADIHLRQRPGTDVALINALMNVILSEGLEDSRFIAERTEGFEEIHDSIMKNTPEFAEKITGVPAEAIRRAARVYAGAESASIIYSMGITQHTSGTDNVMALANLAMMSGNVGKEASGVNPLRGQNNVQGACDLGALPNVYSGYQKVDDPAARGKFEAAWGCALPAVPGLTVVEIMNAAAVGEIRGLYIMGENPMLSDPDINHVQKGLENLDFLLVQDIFLSETARLADIVLPACCFAEKNGTFTNTERRVQRVRKAVEPPGEALEDWRIIGNLAEKMGYSMNYRSAEEIQEEICRLTPSYAGITYPRLEKTGLQWPCPDVSHGGTQYLHKDSFARGLGKFHLVEFLPPREMPDSEYPIILTTGRMLEHWHTGTMTRKCRVLDDLVPQGALEISESDAGRLGVKSGDLLIVSSRRGKIEVKANITNRVPEGTVFMAFHFHEHPANALTIAALDPIAKIPELKVCAVKVEKSGR